MNDERTRLLASWIARIALAAAFLSAVGDRFGFWGPAGSPGVAWGNVENYEAFVAQLNWFLPAALVAPVGWIATLAEITIAVGLLVGWRLRAFALAAAFLLTLFGATMAIALGTKAPLDYSVFSAMGAALLLFTVTPRASGRTADAP